MGGLYTSIIIKDFLPSHPGRAAFCPGESEYGAKRSWTESLMAALHKRMGMLELLNLRGLPKDVRKGLKELQNT